MARACNVSLDVSDSSCRFPFPSPWHPATWVLVHCPFKLQVASRKLLAAGDQHFAMNSPEGGHGKKRPAQHPLPLPDLLQGAASSFHRSALLLSLLCCSFPSFALTDSSFWWREVEGRCGIEAPFFSCRMQGAKINPG